MKSKVFLIVLSSLVIISTGVVLYFFEFQDPRITNLTFNNVKVSKITETGAIFESTTDYPIKCYVEYFEKDSPTNIIEKDHSNLPHEVHKIVVMDLKPDTEYSYRFTTMFDGHTIAPEWMSFRTL
ncbi:hypothetical protein C5F49_02270 [Nitrosopumilus oxyclinae]|uniref:Fibronectin type-III domain-containing protein n=1 Tax=Nitrosopumilus oxyclinae TaxID=1959104 RepID=A0A7D5M5P4_9ARCH|nr:hypothetical protein [Nitrosopumilus oxyclinae]QLH04269.1 hypothetical protein C5F49_02270 [Nitrosopumilus oxyclinae]